MTTLVFDKKKDFDVIPAVRWEQVPCNLCGRDDTEPYHHERLPYFDKILDFQIVRCRHCGLVYTNPRLADYNATYMLASNNDPEEIERHGRAKAPVFAAALNEIEFHHQRYGRRKLKAKGKLLDIGCGSGHFLAVARQRGFDVCGIESAAVPAAYAVKKFSVPVINKDILDADLPAESFDVITAWDVIEHLGDPRAVMLQCVRWLRPGGIMALRFPSAGWQKIKGVIMHQLLASKRAVFAATIHLYFFDNETFTQMIRPMGLEILRAKTTPAEANTNNVLIDGIKLVSYIAIRGIEALRGKLLGNLEIYCRKQIFNDQSNT